MKKNKLVILGIVLLILSGIALAAMLLIPFLKIERETKILLTTIAFITKAIFFWSGGFLVGRVLFLKYRSYMNPKVWFKKYRKSEEE